MPLSDRRRSYLPAFFAVFVVVYYILPRALALGLEMFFLIYSIWENGLPKQNRSVPIIWYSVFFVAFLCIELCRPYELSNYVTTCFNCLIFVWITSSIIVNKNDVEMFIRFFAMAGIIFCISLLPVLNALSAIGVGRMDDVIEVEGGGLMSSSIGIAYVMSLLVICQLWIVFKTNSSGLRRILNLILAFGYLYVTLVTGTRKALFAIVLFVVLYVVIRNRNNKGRLLISSVIVISSVMLLFHVLTENEFLYNMIGHRLEGINALLAGDHQVDDSSLERLSLINISSQIVIENPVLGLGVYKTQHLLQMSHPHNNFLSLLNFGGIVLACLYYWVYLFCIRWYVRIIKNSDNLGSMLCCVLFAVLLTDMFATTYNILYFSVFIALITNYKRMNR